MDSVLQYPTYKPPEVTWLGKLPAHWAEQRLGTLAEMRVSNVDKHSNEGELPVRLCNYVDVYKNDRIESSMPFMKATALPEEINRFRLKTDDVLITKDSETWDDIGVPALVSNSAEDLISGYHLALLRPSNRMVGSYLAWVLRSKPASYQFHTAANGVTRYGLTHNGIRSVVLPVPPLHEQDAIVRYLDDADQRIQKYVTAKERLIALLEEERQAAIHQAVTRGLDPNVKLKPSGVDWLGDVPGHWQRSRIKNILQPVDERSCTGSETLLSLRRDHGIVPYGEHFSRPSQSESLVGYKLVKEEQLVVNRMQANNGLIFNSTVTGVVSPDYSVFQKKSPTEMRLLGELLRTQVYRTYFRQSATGLGTGTAGFLRLYDDTFLETPIFLPSMDEQTVILEYLDVTETQFSNASRRVRRQIELMEEYRTRLIADVVTGKTDVPATVTKLPDPVTG